MAQQFQVRLPGELDTDASGFTPPPNEWLEGTWYVTHSSLKLWHGRQNVTMNYALIPPDEEGIVRIDDTSRYQKVGSSEEKEIHGVDTPHPTIPSAWDWRGTGLLAVTSSQWQLLGCGDLDEGHQWCVTHFAKTLFTPAGLDVYSRKKEGLPEGVLEGILQSLKALESTELQDLVAELYEVPRV